MISKAWNGWVVQKEPFILIGENKDDRLVEFNSLLLVSSLMFLVFYVRSVSPAGFGEVSCRAGHISVVFISA